MLFLSREGDGPYEKNSEKQKLVEQDVKKPADLDLPKEPDLPKKLDPPKAIPEEGTSVDPPTPGQELSPPPPDVVETSPTVRDPENVPIFVKDEELPQKLEAGDAAIKKVSEQVKDMTLNEPVDPSQYPMNHSARGIFVLFNVVNFGGSPDMKREGTDEDADQIERTFELMDFEVIRFDDPKANEMVQILETGTIEF